MKRKLIALVTVIACLLTSVSISPVMTKAETDETTATTVITEDFADGKINQTKYVSWKSIDGTDLTEQIGNDSASVATQGQILQDDSEDYYFTYAPATNANVNKYLSIETEKLVSVSGKISYDESTDTSNDLAFTFVYEEADSKYNGMFYYGKPIPTASDSGLRYVPNKYYDTTVTSFANFSGGSGNNSYLMQNGSKIVVAGDYVANNPSGKWMEFSITYESDKVTLQLSYPGDGEEYVWKADSLSYSFTEGSDLKCWIIPQKDALKIDDLTMTYEGISSEETEEPDDPVVPDDSTTTQYEVTEDFEDAEFVEQVKSGSLTDGESLSYVSGESYDSSKCLVAGATADGGNSSKYLSVDMSYNEGKLLEVSGEIYSGNKERTWGFAFNQSGTTYSGAKLIGFNTSLTSASENYNKFAIASDFTNASSGWTNTIAYGGCYKDTTYEGSDVLTFDPKWISFSLKYDYENQNIILKLFEEGIWSCEVTYSMENDSPVCLLVPIYTNTGVYANLPKIDNLTLTYEGTDSEDVSDINVSIAGAVLPKYNEDTTAQTLGYQCTVSGEDVADITELGILITLKQFVTNENITLEDVEESIAAENVSYIKKAYITDEDTIARIVESGTFYANVGNIPTEYYGARYVVRVYVKDASGNVYYSTSEEDADKGLSGGYAENSFISVVKSYLEFCYENEISNITDVVTEISDTGQFTYGENYNPVDDNAKAVLDWLNSNYDAIKTKVEELTTAEQ